MFCVVIVIFYVGSFNKLLITTRENDWYNYSGDLSNIHSIKVVKPTFDEKEAMEIFKLFREVKQLHPSITSWEKAWHKIAERQLLIEYVYLLVSQWTLPNYKGLFAYFGKQRGRTFLSFFFVNANEVRHRRHQRVR